MTPQLENIGAIETRLWESADTLRANSSYASNEYFLPVMGLLFLRHAYNRFLTVKEQVEQDLPSRGGKTRDLTKEDFSQRGAIFLRPEARFDYLVELSDDKDRIKAVIAAMESIEKDYTSLRDTLPKREYQELDNDVLGQLLRKLNPDELKRVSGDVFGRIYEYFLTKFAGQKAHDGGEFFTPVSLVSLIAHILEPDRGVVLDPACGSGGMFVQSARTVEERNGRPTERLTFRGIEKNGTTIRLAKMNLAVHGLEGDIQQAITYYSDPHKLAGGADYVMANPPFNVDEIDPEKIKGDPRLGFGLPAISKKTKAVGNGNYVWISLFHGYLGERGRAGFVMSSQASSSGGHDRRIRQDLVETGDVDVMVAIGPKFFYTRTVPCELWFFDRAKPAVREDKVLMLDARSVYRKISASIHDFSPEQHNNLLSIVWLYRGETDRFRQLVADYLTAASDAATACSKTTDESGDTVSPLPDFLEAVETLEGTLWPFLSSKPKDGPHAEPLEEFLKEKEQFAADVEAFAAPTGDPAAAVLAADAELTGPVESLRLLAEASRNLARSSDLLFKQVGRLIDVCEGECGAKDHAEWDRRDVNAARKAADAARGVAVQHLKAVRSAWRHAHWLADRFPTAELRDVLGLVRVVDRATIEAEDWSLTPGRYVGVAPEEEDEDFDFEEALREIHVELADLNETAAKLATTIQKNLEGLGL